MMPAGAAPRAADPGPVASAIGASAPVGGMTGPCFQVPVEFVSNSGGPPAEGDTGNSQVSWTAGPTVGGRTTLYVDQLDGQDVPQDTPPDPDDMTPEAMQKMAQDADSGVLT